ncbi:MAG: HAMP domain-containing protein [Tissierellia bacterium]|nr:HAMP domain-containing protein [Tissierellia bacterium]
MNNYKAAQIKNNEIRLFQTANIVADIYKQNIDDIIFARMMLKSYSNYANARILIVDSNKKVLLDSYYSYVDKSIDNEEIRSSLQGQSSSNIYTLDSKEVLQLAVPITSNNNIIGSVLISSDLVAINENVNHLKEYILKIAISGLFISLVLTAIVTNNLTNPLRELTLGVEKITSGNLGYQVKKKSKDEIGSLVENFNKMSSTLSNIEKNRKNFINSISHELKTPLTSIKVLIESLSMGNRDIDTYKEYLKDIYGETERMEKLVNYLMKSIKLEDSILMLREENLEELLEETINIIKPYADKNNVSLNFSYKDSVTVTCDKDKIKEVIFNLIDNAIKYKDVNKKENYVKIFLDKTIDKAILTIEDNGIGIEKDKLEDVFKRGFRVLEGPTRDNMQIHGYGIGLAIVKSLIDKHGWHIYVKSSLDVGTTFTIEIPLSS